MLEKWKSITLNNGSSDFVFTGCNVKNSIMLKYMRKKYREALMRAGINIFERVIVVNSLRHTFNSVMRSLLPHYIIAEIMGHSLGKMPEHYYNPNKEALIEKLQIYEQWRNVINEVWK